MMSNSEISDSGGIDRNSIDDDDSIRDALPVQTDSSSDESSSDDEKIILDTTPVLQPVVNTVLSFCSYGIEVGTIVNVKKIASQTFSFKEISKAHTLLYNLCKNDIVGEKRNRRKKDTCISDVLAWLQDLKKRDKVPYLVVDVAGIAKLPKFNIEDITEVAMCERIQRLEAHVAAIDQSLAECVSDVIDIKSRNTIPVQLDGHPVHPNRGPAQQDGKPASRDDSTARPDSSQAQVDGQHARANGGQTQGTHNGGISVQHADTVRDPAQPVGHPARADDGPDALPACINDDAAVPRGGPAGQPAFTDDVAATQHAGNNGGQAKLDGQHHRTNGDPTTQPECTDGGSTAQPEQCEHTADDTAQAARTGKQNFSDVLNNNREGWQTKDRRRRQIPTKRTNVIYGMATNSIIKSASSSNSYIHVSNIDHSVSANDIKDYLIGAGINVKRVFCISSVSALTKSFKIIVNPSDYDKVFCVDLWDMGTRVRAWDVMGVRASQ